MLTSMKRVVALIACTLALSSCANVNWQEILNPKVQHIPSAFDGRWTDKKPTKKNCYPTFGGDYIPYSLFDISSKANTIEHFLASSIDIISFTSLSDTAFSANVKVTVPGDIDSPDEIYYSTISLRLVNKNTISSEGVKFYRCPKSSR